MAGQPKDPSKRIKESEIDDIFADAFVNSTEFCSRVRSAIGIDGSGLADSLVPQAPHFEDDGTIDLDVSLNGYRLLIENKIRAHWSHTIDGISQPDRYARSAKGWNARSVLIAPRSYLRKSLKADKFNHTISYEALLLAFSVREYELISTAIDQADVPPENRSDVQTAFFIEFGQLMADISSNIEMKKRDRNKRSHTVHLDVRRSLQLHPGLPKPKVFLQFEEANVKLMIPKWGWHVDNLRRLGGHEGSGITLRRVGRVGTLALQLPTPFINCKGPFEPEREKAAEAIRTTARLCTWWDENSDTLRRWQEAIPDSV